MLSKKSQTALRLISRRKANHAKADNLLADVELEQGRALDRLAANQEDTAAPRGDIAMTRLRYGEAAKHYADAAAVLASASTGEQKRLDYLNKEAKALYQQGNEFGDNAARQSIDGTGPGHRVVGGPGRRPGAFTWVGLVS
jgi:hypothetical protein